MQNPNIIQGVPTNCANVFKKFLHQEFKHNYQREFFMLPLDGHTEAEIFLGIIIDLAVGL